MTRPVEIFDSPAAFLAAQKRGGTKPAQRPRDARPDLPRAALGHGDHLAALMRLSAQGWHFYTCMGSLHWFAKPDGTRGPLAESYEAAIAATMGEVGR